MTPRQAYGKVRDAIKDGVLIRPEICQRCGVSPGLASDGRPKIQAHHDDYDKPLKVEWICASCHRKETPFPDVFGAPNYGEKNGFSKLTNADVISAKRLREKGLSFQAIGDRFGVGRHAVMRAVNGKTWLAAAPRSAA